MPVTSANAIRKAVVLTIGAAAGALAIAGCGSYSSSHDNASVNQEIRNGQVINVSGPGPVTRIDTPGYFPAMALVCIDQEGHYVAESGTGIITVVPNDPACGYKGTDPGGGPVASTVGPNKDDK